MSAIQSDGPDPFTMPAKTADGVEESNLRELRRSLTQMVTVMVGTKTVKFPQLDFN